MIKLGKLYINIFTVPLIIAALLTNSLAELAAAYAVVTLHELAHLFTAMYYKVGISGFVIMPFGVCIKLKDAQLDDPITECAICAAGPLCNLMLMIIGFFLQSKFGVYKELFEFFICTNASILLINTVPVVPLDGGRILQAALTIKMGFVRAAKITHFVSQLNIALIGLFGIYILCITRFNVSLMLLCTFLIFNMSAEKRHGELTLMRQIVHYKEKLVKREIMPVRELAVMKNVALGRLLKNFSYDSYYIVNVMGNNSQILATLTETQIIDAAVRDGKRSVLSDLFI